MNNLVEFVTSMYFIGIIVILIIVLSIFKRDKNLVTMVGIFGTFTGIVAGLYAFNVNDVSSSIPNLIEGLKTAFITSIAGLIASIWLGIIEKEYDNKDQVDFLKDIKNEIENGNSQNNIIIDELKKLNKGIGGDSDNSLVNQIKLLKSDGNENHRALKKSFDDFAEKMADNNIDALTEAIEKVMGEFNTIINDKLGKTFDDFKKSVENLNVWQEQYKQNIIDSTESLNLSKESLEKSSKGFEITAEKSEAFAGVSEKLGGELKNLNDSLKIFKNGINEFDGVAKNTKSMADSMTESINSLTENFVSKAEIMVSESEKQITMMKDVFSEQSKDLKDSHKNILDNLTAELDNSSKHTSEHFIKIQSRLEEQVLELDKKLGEELEKSLRSLGEQLTGLSSKFVSDYGNLAKQLEKLVVISNK